MDVLQNPMAANMGADLAIDTQSLGRLRAQAKQSPDQALKAAAQQFEAVFMNMMLKSMREATPQDGMMDNDQSRMFTGMLDQQLSQSLSSRGIGLADMMVKQLSRGGQPSQLLSPQSSALSPQSSVLSPQSSVLSPRSWILRLFPPHLMQIRSRTSSLGCCLMPCRQVRRPVCPLI